MHWREWLGLGLRIQDFAHVLLRHLRAKGQHDWRYEAAQDTLVRGESECIYLKNLFLDYRQAPRGERSARIQRYLNSTAGGEIPKLWNMARKAVYPSLRSRYMAPLMQLQLRIQGGEAVAFSPAARTWAGELGLQLVYDFGDYVAQIQEDQLDTWGQSFDSVLADALENLARLRGVRWSEVVPGVMELSSEASYNETLVLDPEVRAALPFAERAVFMACNRGVLLAADREAPEALAALLDLAADALANRPWPQSADLIVFEGESPRLWQPPEAGAELLRELQLQEQAGIYRDQQQLLEALLETLGEDVFVAQQGLLRTGSGKQRLHSYCVWSEGVHGLLPVSDLIALVRGEPEDGKAEVMQVPWAEVERVCAGLMKATEHSPVRIEVTGFPGPEQWDQLKRHEVQLG